MIYDQVGSLGLVANASGNVVKKIDYDSFGNIIADTNPAFNIPFGFAGGLHDRDTGLVRFGYRDYDPETGRWTANDPILFAGGDTDLYGYVQNNPVNLIDPEGLFDIALTPYAVAAAPAIAMIDSPVLPFADTLAGALIGLAWLHDNWPANLAEKESKSGSCPDDLTAGDILKDKKGSIKNAPLPKGSPSWDDISGKPFSEIEKEAQKNTPGFKTIRKLLTDARFNK